jgi:hypothetical protein
VCLISIAEHTTAIDSQFKQAIKSVASGFLKNNQDGSENDLRTIFDKKSEIELAVAKSELIYKTQKSAIHIQEQPSSVTLVDGTPMEVANLKKGDECIITKDGKSSRFVVIEQIKK